MQAAADVPQVETPPQVPAPPTPASAPRTSTRRRPGSADRNQTMRMPRVVELLDAVDGWLANDDITDDMMSDAVAELRVLVIAMYYQDWIFNTLMRQEDAIDVVRDAIERLWRRWRASSPHRG